jgi:hypothetical protein
MQYAPRPLKAAAYTCMSAAAAVCLWRFKAKKASYELRLLYRTISSLWTASARDA